MIFVTLYWSLSLCSPFWSLYVIFKKEETYLSPHDFTPHFFFFFFFNPLLSVYLLCSVLFQSLAFIAATWLCFAPPALISTCSLSLLADIHCSSFHVCLPFHLVLPSSMFSAWYFIFFPSFHPSSLSKFPCLTFFFFLFFVSSL